MLSQTHLTELIQELRNEFGCITKLYVAQRDGLDYLYVGSDLPINHLDIYHAVVRYMARHDELRRTLMKFEEVQLTIMPSWIFNVWKAKSVIKSSSTFRLNSKAHKKLTAYLKTDPFRNSWLVSN